jgi:hypothetical protein
MTRTPEEVFAHQVEALGAGDLDEIVADYTQGGQLLDRDRGALDDERVPDIHALATH